jgi:hypothetical protein
MAEKEILLAEEIYCSSHKYRIDGAPKKGINEDLDSNIYAVLCNDRCRLPEPKFVSTRSRRDNSRKVGGDKLKMDPIRLQGKGDRGIAESR